MDRVDGISLESVELEGELPREIVWGGHGEVSLRASLRPTGDAEEG